MDFDCSGGSHSFARRMNGAIASYSDNGRLSRATPGGGRKTRGARGLNSFSKFAGNHCVMMKLSGWTTVVLEDRRL